MKNKDYPIIVAFGDGNDIIEANVEGFSEFVDVINEKMANGEKIDLEWTMPAMPDFDSGVENTFIKFQECLEVDYIIWLIDNDIEYQYDCHMIVNGVAKKHIFQFKNEQDALRFKMRFVNGQS